MPRTYQKAARSTREMASNRRRDLILNGLLAIGGVVVVYLLLTNGRQFGIGGVGLLVLLLLIRVIPDLFDRYSRKQEKLIRRADRGADAEEDIARILDGLDNNFMVLHDVDCPNGNIDHIVISQSGGVILLETKSHRGTVTLTDTEIQVNGDAPEKDFVAQALTNSLWLRGEVDKAVGFTPWVTPYVVFTNAYVKFGKPIKGVRAINKKFLLNTLQTTQSRDADAIWTHRERIVQHLMDRESQTN